ncbi:MAG TPA: ATP-binding protein [Terriglobales bacterium]|nr:ATP-binding protein [Terriglobales bacterium]
MRFRNKLLLAFALTVFLCVAAVAWIATALTRHTFDEANEQRTSGLVAQFRREFDHQGEEVGRRVEAIAQSDAAIRMAISVSYGPPDYAAFLNEAASVAEGQQLDFLEFVDRDGTIISSAQWPAKFGYKEDFPVSTAPARAFLKQEQLPDGTALSLTAIRRVNAEDSLLYVLGGRKLDKNFLASLDPPAGMRVFFYQDFTAGFSAQSLISPSGPVEQASALAPLIQKVQQEGKESTRLIHWSSNGLDDELVDAIPLTGANRQIHGILLVASSRRPYLELEQHVRSAALIATGAGMLLAIVLSGWVASRVTRPVEQLAQTAREVAAGNWKAQATIDTSGELAELAESFNQMTRELLQQRERLVQAERVAAWRELARRLAHELKNPLFPLQLTVENLLRSRQQSPEQFDETFQESASTLLSEIANLKAIVSRFSEFSKMPQPQFQRVQLNDVVRETARFFEPQLAAAGRRAIQAGLDLDQSLEPIAADAELLHRVLSNLILNAIDAMPNGGTLALRTFQSGGRVGLEVSDAGTGMTSEECEHLFTPYYTTKAQGTGLGLAIAQSVISDHGGRISVRSKPGEGTTFTIELPVNADRLQAADRERSGTTAL